MMAFLCPPAPTRPPAPAASLSGLCWFSSRRHAVAEAPPGPGSQPRCPASGPLPAGDVQAGPGALTLWRVPFRLHRRGGAGRGRGLPVAGGEGAAAAGEAPCSPKSGPESASYMLLPINPQTQLSWSRLSSIYRTTMCSSLKGSSEVSQEVNERNLNNFFYLQGYMASGLGHRQV